MKRYDLNLLRSLDLLLRERSVSGAARKLGIGQPAMSAALARLRLQFDDSLLVRGARGMELTPRAAALAEPLHAGLAELYGLIEPLEPFDPSTARRTFRLSGGDYVGMTIMPLLASAVLRSGPDIDLRFRYVEKDLVWAKLDNNELDLALLVHDEPPARFRTEALLEETFVCAARSDHPVFDQPLTLERFASMKHLLVTERGDDYGYVDRLLAERGLCRRIAMTVPGAGLVSDILEMTDLISTVPRRIGERIGATGSVRVIEPPVAMAPWRQSMAWSTRNERDPGLLWLREQLRRVTRDV